MAFQISTFFPVSSTFGLLIPIILGKIGCTWGKLGNMQAYHLRTCLIDI